MDVKRLIMMATSLPFSGECHMPYLPERIVLAPLIKAFLLKRVEGLENISRDTPYIFAANHNSHIDEFVIMPPIYNGTKRVTHFFADRKHWFQGKIYFRFLAWWFKAIPVDRGKGTGDDALKRGINYLKKGHNVIIYPEGTRGDSFELGRGKVGVAKMALWSKAPVVPMGVIGTHLLMPKGRHFPAIKRVVTVKIGKPIYFNDLSEKLNDQALYREMTDRIMKDIANLLGQEYKYNSVQGQSTSP
jgi:1-acyl-sn-glycerol-3-phosphate acyltransferase